MRIRIARFGEYRGRHEVVLRNTEVVKEYDFGGNDRWSCGTTYVDCVAVWCCPRIGHALMRKFGVLTSDPDITYGGAIEDYYDSRSEGVAWLQSMQDRGSVVVTLVAPIEKVRDFLVKKFNATVD